ncbi:hypothetical protein C1645_872936 [Glomus cerebriforme]|uniref:Uncharacterized protein n=1 Tax=Glomus cerebriforme TaxID=658196 RepID=A0A397TJK5_9GLOM|nr:hypothetical protein C1645_872936 [Glomus cerebriforme]
MSSKGYKPRTRGAPYVQKINLSNNNKRNPTKLLCPYCKEINDRIKLLSSKVNKIEEIVNNFDKLSTFNKILPDGDMMELDDPSEYALYCSSEYDPMELD